MAIVRTFSGRVDGRHIGALACLLFTSCLYLFTLAPTVQGFDSAELTVGAYSLGFIHAPGYPLYMLLGHLFAEIPVGDVGMRLNLMSAMFGISASLVLYALLLMQTRKWLAALATTFLFSTMPVFWSQAVRTEVYTLHTFLMASALLAWLHAHRSGRIDSYVLCFMLLGLGLGNHMTTFLLWVPVLACTIWASPQWRKIGLASSLLGLSVAGLLYLYFPVRSLAGPQIDYIGTYFGVDLGDVTGVWWLISNRMFRCSFYLPTPLWTLLRDAGSWGVTFCNNLLGVGVILGAWGWVRMRQLAPLWNRLLTLYFLTNLVVFLCYHVVDKDVMFTPMYLVSAIWIADGVVGLAGWLATHLRSADPHRIAILASVALLFIASVGVGLNWSSVDLSHNRRAYDFAAQVLEEVESSATIVNHWVTASVFDYMRIVEGKRPDVRSFNLDFFVLAVQTQCDAMDDKLAQQAWFSWLGSQSQSSLCFIEPLPPVPSNLRWVKGDTCWKAAAIHANQ